jgi:MFS family permease
MAASEPAVPAAFAQVAPAPSAHPAASRTRAWIVLGVLCFVYVLNFLDRQLLSILAKPIQDSLHLKDTQLGLIGGLYFALFYCLISIPVGWLADRTNRVRVLALACAIWSAATMGCGLSATYSQLVAARMAVGVGEAGGVPPSYAIISDYFPPGRRGLALGLFNLGPPIGQALGIAFGAAIAARFSWRYAFLSIGLVGVFAALAIILLVPEPRQGGLDKAAPEPGSPMPASPSSAKAPFWPTLKMFFTHPALVLAALGSGATQIVTYGSVNFTSLLLMREKGMTLQQLAIWFALVVGLGMTAGIFVSGRAIDRFTRRSKTAYGLLPAGALVIAIPFYIAFVHAAAWPAALGFLLVPTFFNYFYLTSVVALVQDEVAPNQRVLSGALLLLVMNLVGLGLGPTFVGAMSDYFKPAHPHHSLQLAFYALLPFYGLAVALFLALAQVLRKQSRLSTGASHA